MAWENTNQEIVYSALMHGIEVEIGDRAFGMSDAGDLVSRCASYTITGEKSHLWMPASLSDTSMISFYSLCEELTSEEKAAIVASIVLNKTSGR